MWRRLRPLARGFGRALGTIGFVILLNFVLFRLLPGDPVRAAARDPRLGPEVQEALRQRFGLDRPLVNGVVSLRPLIFGGWGTPPLETQLGRYLRGLCTGDLGVSFQTGEAVTAILAQKAAHTALLVLPAQLLAILLGTALGALAAWRAGRVVDVAIIGSSLLFWGLPTFWLAILLLFAGSGQFGLPLAGMGTPGPAASGVAAAADLLRHLLLPTSTQALVYLAQYALLARSTLLEVLNEDFILTARARGLSPLQVLRRHAARNAALPLVTLAAVNLGFTVSGAIQVETVFSWPGLGLATYDAVIQRDYPMLQGTFLLLTVAVISANLLADGLYAVLDPRLRDASAAEAS